MISVIIPARNEPYLGMTIRNVQMTTNIPIEFIVILDGETDYSLPNYSNLTIIKQTEPQGIRVSLNKGVKASHGDYLLKLDGHCLVEEGFIEILRRDCQEDEVMVTRRYTLDINNMTMQPRRVDYFYLSCPWTYPRGFLFMQSCPWITQTEQNLNIPIDDLMCFQGSMWFMSRKHWDWLEGLQEGLKYTEHHEISFKTWLGGRRVVINKNTCYAHPSQRASGYRMDMSEVYHDHEISAHYWTENKWGKQVHNFDWLIDKFWPLPTQHNRHRLEKYYWEEDWRKYVN